MSNDFLKKILPAIHVKSYGRKKKMLSKHTSVASFDMAVDVDVVVPSVDDDVIIPMLDDVRALPLVVVVDDDDDDDDD